ncbi:protein of unknown function [Streptococcus thermophilus]|nr:protein of unknown function [Streptococcus thermophilus]
MDYYLQNHLFGCIITLVQKIILLYLLERSLLWLGHLMKNHQFIYKLPIV